MTAYARIEHAGGALSTTLASDITSGDTSLSLTAGSTWPTGGTGPFYLVIDPATSSEEKILATARSSNSLTGLTRGVDGTSAAAHSAGAVIKHVFSAVEADEANQTVHATLGAVTTKGDLLPASAANTLTRLAAGSNGLPLVANSAQTTGLNYAALAAVGLASGSVTTAKIAAGAVTTTELGATAVTTAKIAAGAVTTTEILDGTILPADLSLFPYVELTNATNQTIAAATWTSLVYDTTVKNVGSGWSGGTFTAPTAGVYAIAFQFVVGQAGALWDQFWEGRILKNSTDFRMFEFWPKTWSGGEIGESIVTSCARSFYLAVNDTLKAQLFTTPGGSGFNFSQWLTIAYLHP